MRWLGRVLGGLTVAAAASAAFADGAAAPAAPPSAPAAGAPFAALTVTPNGAQRYDISTGVTTLPDGGTVVDKASGVRLVAAQLTYVEGAYIDAASATVSGAFGTFTVDKVHVNVKTGVLTASGRLSLTRDALRLSASAVRYDANRRVADFAGPVTGTSPDFRADRLLLDADSGDVLLIGQYVYTGGMFTLTSPQGGGRLELTLHQQKGTPVYDAATQVSSELLARFAGELH